MNRDRFGPTLGGDLTTLLAVDDSKTMRRVLEITFAGEAFETQIAASAEDAFTRLSEGQTQIALVDVTLGEGSGYDVCKRIKADYPSVRVLLLSSKHSPYDPAKGAAAGADDHLDKPFDTQVLIDKVSALAARMPSHPAQAATAVPAAHPTIEPDDYGDSGIPTAMPEAPDESLDEDDGPILIPIDEPAPAPQLDQRPTTAVAPSSAPRPVAQPARLERTMPAAPTPNGGSPSSAVSQDALGARLAHLGLTEAQVSGVLALSKEVIEAAVWEVVPALAEVLIKEELRRLTQ